MPAAPNYPLTHQGVRDLDHPIRRHPGSGRVNVGPVERTVSTLTGAVLAGFGVGNGGTVGLLLAAVGGALAYRGVTGHCPAYGAAGVSTAG